jgi:hypothetical protein
MYDLFDKKQRGVWWDSCNKATIGTHLYTDIAAASPSMNDDFAELFIGNRCHWWY